MESIAFDFARHTWVYFLSETFDLLLIVSCSLI